MFVPIPSLVPTHAGQGGLTIRLGKTSRGFGGDCISRTCMVPSFRRACGDYRIRPGTCQKCGEGFEAGEYSRWTAEELQVCDSCWWSKLDDDERRETA